MNIDIRELKIDDLESYEFRLNPQREFHKYNGPYYKKFSQEELSEYVRSLRDKFISGEEKILDNQKIIVNKENQELIGQVNWYWKSKETNWLEVGIVIFNENYWGTGIGYIALKEWINIVFRDFPEIIRIGLSTWSGNERMMKLAEKLGLEKEATYKMARIIDGKYYDSVSYGILKKDWGRLNSR